jgi:hypothetical protein
MVDVTGIDRDQLLVALWQNAKPAALFVALGMNPRFNLAQAKRAARGTYVEYACGRCIEADVFGDSTTIDPQRYDINFGRGAFQRVVDALRASENETATQKSRSDGGIP